MDQEGWQWEVLSFTGHEFSSLSQNRFNQHLIFRVQPLGMAQMALGTTEQ